MPKTLRMRKKSRLDPPHSGGDNPASHEGALALRRLLSKSGGRGQSSKLEEKVAADLKALGLMEGCLRQFKFCPTRKWKADFAWLAINDEEFRGRFGIMLEVNGGTYIRGAHSRGVRQRNDYEKWSTASLMGWTVLLVDSADVKAGVHVERVLQATGRKSNEPRNLAPDPSDPTVLPECGGGTGGHQMKPFILDTSAEIAAMNIALATVEVHELIDSDMIREVGDGICALTDKHKRLVIDFRHVGAFSSHMLGKLIRIRHRLHKEGGRLVLCGSNEALTECMEVTGLRRLFEIYDDRGQALRSFQSDLVPWNQEAEAS